MYTMMFMFHTLRKTAFPQRSSLSEVNWWRLHLFNAQLATSYSLSVQLHSTSNIGLTIKQRKLEHEFHLRVQIIFLDLITLYNHIIYILPNTSSSAPPWKSSGVIELYIDIVILCSITFFCSVSICSSYFYKKSDELSIRILWSNTSMRFEIRTYFLSIIKTYLSLLLKGFRCFFLFFSPLYFHFF